MLFWTIPRWERLVTEPVRKSGGSESVIFTCLFCSIFLHMLHMVNYFYIVRKSGSISVGVLKACQAIGTFALSAYSFCEMQESQCFTFERGMATVVVCFGVVLYSYSKANLGKGGKGRRRKDLGKKEIGVEMKGMGVGKEKNPEQILV
ncbi:hypothetical protein TL16_g05220 [Triparma laevis f. inornata]|nr:hypothetical protein TL16_g05220 [Triparma laevis f. inornata]